MVSSSMLKNLRCRHREKLPAQGIVHTLEQADVAALVKRERDQKKVQRASGHSPISEHELLLRAPCLPSLEQPLGSALRPLAPGYCGRTLLVGKRFPPVEPHRSPG